MNTCLVCKPYSHPGYQQLEDGSEIPCYGCNRQEFEKSALSTERNRGQVLRNSDSTLIVKLYDGAVRDLLKAAREASQDCDGIPELDVAITRLDLLLRDEPGDARANQLDDDSCRTCGGPAMKCGHSPEAAYYHGPDDYGCSLCEAEGK